MEQSGSWNRGEEVIITTKQPLFRFIISLFFTIFFWTYSLFVLWFFVSALLHINDRYSGILKIAFKTTNGEIRSLLFLELLIFALLFLYLLGWRTYNKKRFGHLTRRKPPKDVTIRDLEALNLLSKENIIKLQSEHYIEFESNPVQPLNQRSES